MDNVRDNRECVGMSDDQLDPAKSVIAKAGGVDAVVSMTGNHISRVYRWMRPKDKGGTGGVIPHRSASSILRHAKASGLPITEADFFPSNSERESA
ncbi:hypothetical protein H4N61_06370 [Devosia sp. MC521]|nr:hypothetical protein [Devosia sp. MC521]QMW64502.1 hypothetical protein H4N61_06370 [Devosia sp. MC521]